MPFRMDAECSYNAASDSRKHANYLRATVSFRESGADSEHVFSAVPVVQSQVVALHDAVSGMTCVGFFYPQLVLPSTFWPSIS